MTQRDIRPENVQYTPFNGLSRLAFKNIEYARSLRAALKLMKCLRALLSSTKGKPRYVERAWL